MKRMCSNCAWLERNTDDTRLTVFTRDGDVLFGGDCAVPMPMQQRDVLGDSVCRLHQTHDERVKWEDGA